MEKRLRMLKNDKMMERDWWAPPSSTGQTKSLNLLLSWHLKLWGFSLGFDWATQGQSETCQRHCLGSTLTER